MTVHVLLSCIQRQQRKRQKLWLILHSNIAILRSIVPYSTTLSNRRRHYPPLLYRSSAASGEIGAAPDVTSAGQGLCLVGSCDQSDKRLELGAYVARNWRMHSISLLYARKKIVQSTLSEPFKLHCLSTCRAFAVAKIEAQSFSGVVRTRVRGSTKQHGAYLVFHNTAATTERQFKMCHCLTLAVTPCPLWL